MTRMIVLSVVTGVAILSAAARADVTAFSDTFDSYPAGAPLTGNYGGWVPMFNAVDDPANNIVTDRYSSGGGNSLQLYGAHSRSWSAAVYHPVSFPPEFILEFDMMASGDIDNSYVNVAPDHYQDIWAGLFSDHEPWGHGVLLVAFNNGHVLVWGAGVLLDNVVHMRWYHFKLNVNRLDGNVDYWIDGKFSGRHHQPDLAKWGPTLQSLDFGSNAGKGWVDNVRVYTEDASPVTILCLGGTGTVNSCITF